MSESVYEMDEYILDPFQQKKKKRIEAVKKMIKKLEKVELEEFTAKVAVNCGIHKSTVRQYLEELKVAGYIEIEDGVIKWRENV